MLGEKNHNKLNVRKIEPISTKETCCLAGCQGLCSLCLHGTPHPQGSTHSCSPSLPPPQQPSLGQSALYLSCPLRNQMPSNWFSEPRHLRPVASNSIIFITGAKHSGKVFGIGGREAGTFWIPGKCLGRGGGEGDGEQAGRVASLVNYRVVGNCGAGPMLPRPIPTSLRDTYNRPPAPCDLWDSFKPLIFIRTKSFLWAN